MKSSIVGLIALVVTTLFSTSLHAQDDTVEFLNGTVLNGKILEIRKPQREFDFESVIAGRSVSRTYGYDKVHAVTFRGKRFVLTEMKAETDDVEDPGRRSPAQVVELIQSTGSTPPSWLESTSMNHPKSLELDWPLKAKGPWNESKNIGQYLWGRVNPNPSRWKPGAKLLHHVIDLHEGKDDLLTRDYQSLGNMYFVLFQDYARAAYWLEKAKVGVHQPAGIHLAECYYRLGSKEMALDLLRGKRLHFDAIKLYGEMGELDAALKLTQTFDKTRVFNEAFLNAGDALRSAGKLDEAINYYQQILDRNSARNPEYLARYKGRAADSIHSIKLFDKADVSKVSDGKYSAKAIGYNGDLHVEVKVQNAKVVDLRITKHREKQFYAALTDTPKQIIDKQSIREIDGTSGATITSQAIVNATARALAQGN